MLSGFPLAAAIPERDHLVADALKQVGLAYYLLALNCLQLVGC